MTFDDLIPDSKAAKISFDDLVPIKQQPSLSDAITDVPSEIRQAFNDSLKGVQGLANRGQQGPIEGLLNTGRAVLSIPQMLASPITGAARSLIGHPMAQAEHAVGSIIAPDIAAKDDPQQMYETAKGDVDTAMSGAAGRGASAGAAVRVPTISELKAAAKVGFESPEVENLAIKAPTIINFSKGAKTALNEDGFDEILAPKTFGVLAKLEAAPGQAFVTGKNIQTIRRTLSKAAESVDPTEKAAASAAIDHLDNFLPSIRPSEVASGNLPAAVDTLETARGNWAAAKRSESLDKKTIDAEIRASASHSGMNVANTVRQRMADVLIKPKEQRGLLPGELAQVDQIVRGTKGQNALRYAGNLAGGGGGLGALHGGSVGAGVGAFFGGPVGAAVGATAVPALGYAMKALSNRMTINQAARLSSMVRSRAPLADAMKKFDDTMGAAKLTKEPSAIVGAMVAARDLASNLRGAGFNVGATDLLQGLQDGK